MEEMQNIVIENNALKCASHTDNGKFFVSVDKSLIDFELVYQQINNSYWAKGISREVMQRAIDNALCFGVYRKADGGNIQQVGFARMITDQATFAYLADVFIVKAYQGLGLSKAMMEVIIGFPSLQGLRRMMLATSDAHGLYKQFGFEEIAQPEILMQSWNPNVYQNR